MRHPLHPALVHFPIAAWVLASLLDGVGMVRPQPLLAQATAGLLAFGCVAGLLAAGAGFLELLRLPDGHPAERAAYRHMALALTSWCLYAGSLALRVHGTHWSQMQLVAPGVAALALSGVGLLAVLITGRLGGTLVYGYGVGVQERE